MQGSSFVGDGKGVNERERLRDQTNTQQDDDWVGPAVLMLLLFYLKM